MASNPDKKVMFEITEEILDSFRFAKKCNAEMEQRLYRKCLPEEEWAAYQAQIDKSQGNYPPPEQYYSDPEAQARYKEFYEIQCEAAAIHKRAEPMMQEMVKRMKERERAEQNEIQTENNAQF